MSQPAPLKTIGCPFIELQSVDSTNNYARQQIHANLAQDGMTIFAHEQTAGKGQMGRKWEGEKSANIALSIIIKPGSLSMGRQFQLSACAAVSAYELFSEYAGDATKIKWPNDLYWQDRKAGGILVESVIRSSVPGGTWDWAIIGTGININQANFPAWLPNPVSLKQITGNNFDPLTLTSQFCSIFEKNLHVLLAEGFDKIYNRYLAHLYKKDETVKFKKGNRVFQANIKSVSPSGKLIAQHIIEEEFDFGEVEWILNK